MSERAPRFAPIDALRGVAALAVLVFHLFYNGAIAGVLKAATPAPVAEVAFVGQFGVAVFFVLSGFVIAYTTRDLGGRLVDGLRYSARRQLRLDPPYWVMLAGVLAYTGLERLVPGLVYQSHSTSDVVLNALYLQEITGRPALLAVAWTLCLEVQFYLVVVVMVLVSHRLAALLGKPASSTRLAQAGFTTVAAISLAGPFLGLDFGPWFLGSWWMFFAGMTLCWFMIGRLSVRGMIGVLVVLAGWCVARDLFTRPDELWLGKWAGWLTVTGLAVLVATRSMTRRAPGWLLWFGTISYSLYLVHLPVIDAVVGAGFKVTGRSITGAVVLYVVGAAVSIGAAWLLHIAVERPAMRLASRVTVARGPADRQGSLAPEPAQRHTA